MESSFQSLRLTGLRRQQFYYPWCIKAGPMQGHMKSVWSSPGKRKADLYAFRRDVTQSKDPDRSCRVLWTLNLQNAIAS